jgi:uncharacterized protein (TIGR02453 family)
MSSKERVGMFTGFSKKGQEFLAKIEQNNNKEWFEAHRGEYEDTILAPCREFVVEMGEHLQALEPTVNIVPKINGSLFKIYRDSRYHRINPIKTRIGVIFWQGSGKRMASSSFYMHFSTKELFLAVGIRSFKPDMLKCYREYIKVDAHREALHVILEKIKEKGYLIPEQRYKRYPKGFKEEISYAYLSLHNSMFAYTQMKPNKTFFTKEFPDTAYNIYEDMFELQQWVYEMTLTLEVE